jgi:hypothetical protein
MTLNMQHFRYIATGLLSTLLINTVSAETSLLTDVQHFLERRAHCDHARGEEAYNAERQQQLQLMQCSSCLHTDRQLAKLRSKYAQHPQVIAQLADLESKVEDKDSQALCRKVLARP